MTVPKAPPRVSSTWAVSSTTSVGLVKAKLTWAWAVLGKFVPSVPQATWAVLVRDRPSVRFWA